MRRTTVLAALLILPASRTAAQRLDYSSFELSHAEDARRAGTNYMRCIHRAQGSDSLVGLCLDAEFELQDAALNHAYRAAMARQPDTAARDRLRADERLWLAQRNPRCNREVEAQGSGPPEGWGTLDNLGWRFCALHEIVRRTAWLERLR